MKFVLLSNSVLCEKILSCGTVLLPLLFLVLLCHRRHHHHHHHHHHLAVMELNHLTLPSLAYPGVSSVMIHGSFCLLACSLLLSCVTSCFDKCLNVVLVPEHFMKVHYEVPKSSDPSRPRS
jgi:hypothetical protein